VERRAGVGSDLVTVTGAYAAVAETGSVVLLSSAESPTTLNFLPDDHLVVVRESQIVAHIEDVWTRMRKDKRAMPRTVNFISGPSKTADVEQTIQEGAHGPRRLHVILVAD
jgi:L-lactate utilization protein LutC